MQNGQQPKRIAGVQIAILDNGQTAIVCQNMPDELTVLKLIRSAENAIWEGRAKLNLTPAAKVVMPDGSPFGR